MKTSAIILAAALGITGADCRASDIAIVHARIYPAPGVATLVDGMVLIHDGRIAAVSDRVALPPGTTVLACDGCVILAGFWNAHVHFVGPQWLGVAHLPPRTLERQLQQMLTHSGFTSVVDTGSDPAVTNELRRRIERGEVAGPHIRTAGLPVFPAKALPFYLADLPSGFTTKVGQPASPDEARDFVARNLAAGADITKLFTGSIVAPEQVQPMRRDIAAAAASESHRLGAIVFAHPTNLEGVRIATASGVDVLAHALEDVHGFDQTEIRDLARRRVTIVPTLKLFAQDRNIQEIRRLVLRAHRAGVPLVFGTDTGFLADYDVSEEYRQLSLAGLKIDDILAMLTTAPAALFKTTSHQGRVAPGMDGDLTVLGSDPKSEGVRAFSDVRYTIRAGKVLFDRAHPEADQSD
ncbi:amidohydrolase family protein [Scleromatobacter humisilvae]|uniref:Amidohydrolase family protein n=1 Tax=Scleromatobacter humisilvae TaxID=2897159 RepID=A0A9X2BY86_9BURK|nr:amidohydrolase family protein [Scleromatobacter humisilvae]MCK9685368.1 amidohydrolase family protein [Scleromatobacter humisilvae]